MMTRTCRVEPTYHPSELASLLRELRLILLQFWPLVVPWQDMMTTEEGAKYEAYVKLMEDHNLMPRTAEEWLEHYRSVQARRRGAGGKAPV